MSWAHAWALQNAVGSAAQSPSPAVANDLRIPMPEILISLLACPGPKTGGRTLIGMRSGHARAPTAGQPSHPFARLTYRVEPALPSTGADNSGGFLRRGQPLCVGRRFSDASAPVSAPRSV